MFKERGVISPSVIVAIIIALASAGAAAWVQQQRLEVSRGETKIVQEKLDVANDKLIEVADKNTSLEATIKTMKALTKVAQDEAKAHQSEADTLATKTATRIKKLPAVSPKSSEPVESPEQTAVSFARAALVWEAFCESNPDPLCTPLPEISK